MGELADKLTKLTASEALTPRSGGHPAGWEPGVAWDGTKGTLTTSPLTTPPNDWAELLAIWGLDPEKHEVIEPVGFRAWDANTGEGDIQRMYYYKANIRLRRTGPRADVDELIKLVKTHKRAKTVPTGERAFVVCLADIQIGKGDGDGTEGTIQRVLDGIDAVENRVKELRKCGRSLGSLYVFGLGDLLESCTGHYAQQEWRTELTLTEQLRVVRQLIVKALTRWSALFDRVVVAAVGGNHGETRNASGKSFTDFADNHDVDVFAAASEVLAANPAAYGHVSFVFPQGQELTITLDVAGTHVGLAHGHQFRSVQKVMDWWAQQAHGRQPIGDADLLLTGHFHHLRLVQDRKSWIQCPALDGGSDWWRHLSGNDAPPGILTLVVGGGTWSDLAVV